MAVSQSYLVVYLLTAAAVIFVGGYNAPRYVQLVASQRAGCVDLSWTEPDPDITTTPKTITTRIIRRSTYFSCKMLRNSEVSFQYLCYCQDRPPFTTYSTSATRCGFSGNELVTCHVSALHIGRGASIYVNASATTKCTAPQEVEINSRHNTSMDSNRTRWIYTFNWQRPASNCNSIKRYNIWYQIPNQNWMPAYTTTTSYTIYADGFEKIRFVVSAENNEGLVSSNSTQSLTTSPLRPQLAPRYVALAPSSSTCVTLSWQQPEWPNGLITGYQYRCNSGSWVGIANVVNQRICGFNPFERVECDIKAVNSEGNSNEATSGVMHTDCDAPSKPVLDVTQSVTEAVDGRDRVAVLVTWKAVVPNCRQVSFYNARLGQTEKKVLTSDDREFVVNDLEPHKNYTVIVEVVNNENFKATTTIIWLTRGTRPAPPSFDMLFNTSCVSLSITAPDYPYNFITHYKTTCRANIIHTAITNVSDVNQGEKQAFCGFLSATNISCEVSAVNEVGESLSVLKSGYTHVKTPSPAVIAVSTIIGCAVAAVLIVAVIWIRRRRQSPIPAAQNSSIPLDDVQHSAGVGAANVYQTTIKQPASHVYDAVKMAPNIYANLNVKVGSMPFGNALGSHGKEKVVQEFQSLETTLNSGGADNPMLDSRHEVTVNGRRYRDAVLLDSVHKADHFIAMHMHVPTNKDMEDLWRMVLEYNISLIVQFDAQITDYYPAMDDQGVYLGEWELETLDCSENDLLSLTTISIDGREVIVMVIKDWSERGVKPDGLPPLKSLLYYIKVIEQCKGQGNICIADGDECSESGLLVTAYNVISGVKSTQQADVYNAALNVRRRRKQFLSSVESYQYIYELLDFYKRTELSTTQ